MIDNEYYFKKRAVLSKDWLHATIVKFSALGSRQVLPVERLFMCVGNLLLGDPLPVKCHYRPLLRAMVHRMFLCFSVLRRALIP